MPEQLNMKSALQKSPIAIIGLAGIFPQAENLQTYWDNIVKEVDCITDVPPSRWEIDDYYDPDPTAPDKTYCKRGGFIPDIDFNPMEFGLPPNILEVTDVSQLLSLVVAKQAMKDAGYDEAREFDRTTTGVVLGVGGGQKLITPLTSRLQYPVWDRVLESSGVDESDRAQIIEKMKKAYIHWEENSFPGMLGNVISGRVANRLDLGGMNCVVDAACAASLAAIKMAVTELTDHRADMMLTGGVDTDNSIFMYMSFSKTPAFSKKNDIRPFDDNADGMMIGEGVGMLLLKRLEDAERDNDTIYAVIKGIGTSSDGRYKSIYAPRASGQAMAVERAYQDAGFPPATVGLVEAHGTGTPAGDPTEFNGLNKVFSHNNPNKQHIALGSVKSQIGHTKAAAGAASLVKTALALHHKTLPPTLNIEKPNRKMEIENSPFYLNTRSRPWLSPANGLPRRAGVSAFGFGGTNFHFALEEYSDEHKDAYRLHKSPEAIFLAAPSQAQLVAKCEDELAELRAETGAAHYRELIALSQTPNIPTASARLGFVADSLAQAIAYLETAVSLLKANSNSHWEHPKGIFYRQSGIAAKGKVVALFPGQGSQYLEMGQELALNFPPIRNAYRQMDALFVNDGQAPLSNVLFPIPVFTATEKEAQNNTLRRTEFVQPAIGAFSVGLYKLLQAAGFSPDFAAGHSFGELTALWAGGALDDASYFYLAKARGQAMAAPGDPTFDTGTMVAVKGDIDRLQTDLQGLDGITIANYNSTEQVVLAGSKPAMQAAQQHLAAKNYIVTPLPVSAAFHTPFVQHAQQPFAQAIAQAQFNGPRIPVYGNSTAQPYPQQPEAIQTSLQEHILKPVLFSQEIENIYAAGGTIFVEIGPKRILTSLVKEILGERPHVAVAVNASKSKDSDRQLREAYVQLSVVGLPLRVLDPYSLEFDSSTSDKKSVINVSLAGNNYVSPKTQAAFAEALQERRPSPQPAKPLPQPVAKPLAKDAQPPAPATKSIVKTSAKPAMTTGNGRSLTTTAISQSKENKKTMPDPSEFQTQLEKSLEQLHQHQTETARVHETFLKGQEAYAKAVVHLMQTYQTDNGSSTVSLPQPPPPSQPKMPPTNPTDPTNGFVAKQTIPQVVVKPPEPPPPPPKVVLQAAPPTPAPVVAEVETTRIEPVETAVSPPQPTALTAELAQAMLIVVSEKTGYPVEMLEMQMDMESDLGIDSIKRVEILGAMQKQHPELPEVNPAELAELRTLQQIVDHLQPAVAQPHGVPSVSVVAEVEATRTEPVETAVPHLPTTAKTDELAQAMLVIVSEKTGYPVEMLEMQMDMESDLGIDSIKRVEILGAMQKRHPDLPEVNPAELAELRTLQQIVDHLGTNLGKADPTTAGVGSPTKSNRVPALTNHAITRNLVQLKPLPMADFLAITPSQTNCCLLTDDGTEATTAVAQTLIDRGWRVAVLSLPQSVVATQAALPVTVGRVLLADLSEAALQDGLTAVTTQFGAIGSFIQLQPPDADAATILKQTFFIAKHLKETLNEAAQQQTRASFLIVTHLDGALGLDGKLPFNPINGGLFGLCKTVNLEWPHVFCRAVDLRPGYDPQQVADYVLAELHDPNQLVSEVGYGNHGRVTLETVETPLTAYEPNAQIASGTPDAPESLFVVSGGAKGITASCVIHLAQQYPCKFVLLGRSSIDDLDTSWLGEYADEAGLKRQIMQHLLAQGEKPTPMLVGKLAQSIASKREIEQTLHAIQQAGSQVEYLSVDVTDGVALDAALTAVSHRLGTITGIIHGAGVLSDKLIEQKTEADFTAVYATKVAGLQALLQAVPPQQLQHLVLFSSAAGFYGNVGQSDYAIANEILNKTAHSLKMQHPHCHVVAIDWGPWDGGMVTPALKQLFAERNIEVIPLDVGAWLLANELTAANHAVTQTVVGGPLAFPDGELDGRLHKHRIHRYLSLEANPFLRDHIIGGNPVLPTVCAIAWMGNLCEQLYPGYTLFSCDNYQVLKGIVFDDSHPNSKAYALDLEETFKADGKISFKALISSQNEAGKLRFHYRAEMTLLATLPDAPLYSNFDPSVKGSVDKATLYQNGTLFHGPHFQGIEQLLNISPSKVTMRCRLAALSAVEQGQYQVQSFNPFIADGQFQSMVIWARHFHDAGSLPLHTNRGEQFRPIPFDKTTVVSMEVRESSESELVADIFTHDENGRLYARVLGAKVTISKQLNHLFVPAYGSIGLIDKNSDT
ncbi:omega-3 polyunsaturated fatty acid synthase subunit, PfaA [hydrothermal vent metagenome]|uniref:Omega-3 polyunsaturated fatty acid synthase subunit, PfaA n=1 Tax=hydrothermal vent metagenome TaxID=652676 RepID=A0A3B0V5A7_9ZZZZ